MAMQDQGPHGVDVEGAIIDADLLVKYRLVNRAIETVGRSRILGIVLNRAEVASYRYGYHYDTGYYGARGTERVSV